MPSIQINEKLISFVLFLPLFFISLAIHEFSHAFFAYRLGDNTAKLQGRLTLNPIKHIDLFGSVLMPLISFASGSFLIGWAKPVPVNRQNLRNPLRDDIFVSAAGPISNYFLGALLFTVYVILSLQFPEPGDNMVRLLNLLRLGSYFNVFLFAFNLLPIPPLDGSHILYDLFPNRLTATIANSGMYGFLILMFFIYSPLWGYFIKFVNFMFTVFIKIAGG